jgi:hypothetical protein
VYRSQVERPDRRPATFSPIARELAGGEYELIISFSTARLEGIESAGRDPVVQPISRKKAKSSRRRGEIHQPIPRGATQAENAPLAVGP